MQPRKLLVSLLVIISCCQLYAQADKHDMHFDVLASKWDEAIPLGNGMLGALIWQKEAHLRFSLDRADLWDMRPMKGLHRPEFSYAWVQQQVKKKQYTPVQEYFDGPYNNEAAPSKIPGGALEFDTKNWGAVQYANLHIANATCEVKWANGIVLQTYVHATKPFGSFTFTNIPTNIMAVFAPQLVAPKYQGIASTDGGNVNGDDLGRLGYKQGTIKKAGNTITYNQEGWGGFTYQITVSWKKVSANSVTGVWSISSHYAGKKLAPSSVVVTQQNLPNTTNNYTTHTKWWQIYWGKSALQVPDTLLEKQWYLEQYKFGSASRVGAPPITLQAVWTADNGRLPPWKGDYHHDLNTQLSYWPSYSGNHLAEGLAFFDHLDENKANYKRYTKLYFGKNGLAVPGVTTLDGTEMGGWIQYSLSPTVSSWLAQHYYLQWRYSMDSNFLKKRAYPWIKDVATFLENVTFLDSSGHRTLPMSSSPEINDNSLEAWFPQNTNYDLALMKFTFKASAETATALGLVKEAAHYKTILAQFDGYALSANHELKFAPTMEYNQSHRHFSNMMAIHPLGILNWEDGDSAQTIIRNSIHLLDSIGPDYWCGYSYAWMANMKARAKDGDGAAKDLTIFAKAFCSINSFHLNGDQTTNGYSKFNYRPFTLEGNFAFAAGLQEMLLQSYEGLIQIFPAVPAQWQNISFENLRAEGAFLVSATKENGAVTQLKIVAEKGGKTRVKLPFKTWVAKQNTGVETKVVEGGFMQLNCKPGAIIVFENGYE